MSEKTTPSLRDTPPMEGNKSAHVHSPPSEGWQAQPDGVVPELRFPEFRDAPGWEEDEMGDVTFFVNERMPLEQLTLANYVSTENILPDYEGVITASKLPSSSSVTRFKINDVLISNIRPYLKKVWFSNKEGGASNDVIVVRAKRNIDNNYLSFVLKNDVFIEYVMKGAKGVKMPRGDISLMKEYPLAYPSINEQQKIADCLSSLDNLITAQSQKLDALKAHKKGLLQQLFPAEGETLPRLRFPEFRGAPEWEEKRLSELTTYVDYRGKSPAKSDYGIFLVTAKNIKQGYIDYETSKEYVSPDEYDEVMKRGKPKIGDILLTTEAPLGNVAQIDNENIALAQRVIKFRGNSFLYNDFLKHYMLGDRFQRILQTKAIGSTVLGIQGRVLHQLPLNIPSKTEQRKTADCLTSLDNLITAQSQKLDALKAHKKGLMQQLFPT